MKLIKTEEAVGHVLCHDMTQIIKGVTKDARFRKGHIVTEKDIPVLLSMGKENLYVWEKNENMLHEDEAAEILREICQGEHMHASQPKEGKIELTSNIDGILTINVEKLLAVNSLGQMMIATRHSYTPVKKGAKLAATRIIPLIIEKEKMEAAKRCAGKEPLVNVLPYKLKTAALITTGGEGVHTAHLADLTVPDPFADLADALARSSLVAHLGGYLVLVGQFGQQARFVDGVGQRLLDVDVLAGGDGVGGDDGVRVVGRGYHHGIGRFEQFVVHLAVVVVLLGSRVALEHVVGIFPVHVAQTDDVLAFEPFQHRGAAASDTHAQDVELVAGGGVAEFFT